MGEIYRIQSKLNEIDWNYLTNLNTDESCYSFIEKLNNIIEVKVPGKKIVINKNTIRDPWMTKGLRKSTMHSFNLYKESIGKLNTSEEYIRYIQYSKK